MDEKQSEEENILEEQDENEPMLPYKNNSQNKDIDSNKSNKLIETKNDNHFFNDATPIDNLKTKTIRRIPESLIRLFISKYLFFLIIFTIELIFPEIFIFFTKDILNYSSIFNENWISLLVLFSILIVLLLIVFYTKEKIISGNLNILVPISILYLFLILLIFTLSGFYRINFFLSALIIQLITFLFIFSSIKIDAFYNRPFLSLFVSYLIITLGFIFYIISSGINYLGLFIYLMCLMMLIYYIIFGLKFMYIDFINSSKINYSENIPLLFIVLVIMNSNIDIFIRAFKSKESIKNEKIS